MRPVPQPQVRSFTQEEYFKLFAFLTILLLKSGTKVERGFFDTGAEDGPALGIGQAKEFNRLNGELVSLKGKLKTAQKKAEAEFPQWIKERAKESMNKASQVADWRVAPIEGASSDAKETFELLKDETSWPRANKGPLTYLLHAKAGQGKWKALRLEALCTSMKKKGPGRNVTNATPTLC